MSGDEHVRNSDTYTATGVNAFEQAQIWSVFQHVETFADIDFQVTTDRNLADLEFATSVLPSTESGTLLGFFSFPSALGQGGYGVPNNNSAAFPSWNSTPGGTIDVGGFMYGVIIHELGHGLGLGHPHDGGNGTQIMSGVSSSSDRGDFNLNSAPYTSMSYNEGTLLAGIASSVASTGQTATFGAFDVAALQGFYGANTSHRTGNNTYQLDDTNATGTGAGYYTIWDTSGRDAFRYNGSSDALIDLRAATLQYEEGGGGFLSYVDGIIGGRTIANGVVIENARSNRGADTLTGNEANNQLSARSGRDELFGNGGQDTMVGGGGRDLLSGGDDNDRLIGGAGADTLQGGDGIDVSDYSRASAAVSVDLGPLAARPARPTATRSRQSKTCEDRTSPTR